MVENNELIRFLEREIKLWKDQYTQILVHVNVLETENAKLREENKRFLEELEMERNENKKLRWEYTE